MPVKCLLIVLSSNSSVAVVEDIIKDTLQAATLFKQSLRTITCIAGHSSTNSGKKVSNCLKTGHSNRLSTDYTDSFLKFFSKVFLSHRRLPSGEFITPPFSINGCCNQFLQHNPVHIKDMQIPYEKTYPAIFIGEQYGGFLRQ